MLKKIISLIIALVCYVFISFIINHMTDIRQWKIEENNRANYAYHVKTQTEKLIDEKFAQLKAEFESESEAGTESESEAGTGSVTESEKESAKPEETAIEPVIESIIEPEQVKEVVIEKEKRIFYCSGKDRLCYGTREEREKIQKFMRDWDNDNMYAQNLKAREEKQKIIRIYSLMMIFSIITICVTTDTCGTLFYLALFCLAPIIHYAVTQFGAWYAIALIIAGIFGGFLGEYLIEE